MTDIMRLDKIEGKIWVLRNQHVLLDSNNVAELYGVETKRINKAVKNNPDKFPEGYIFELTKREKAEVVENFHYLENIKFSPKSFTEKRAEY